MVAAGTYCPSLAPTRYWIYRLMAVWECLCIEQDTGPEEGRGGDKFHDVAANVLEYLE